MYQCPYIVYVSIVRYALPCLSENRNFPASHAIEESLLKDFGLGFFETWTLSVMVKHHLWHLLQLQFQNFLLKM